MSQEQMGKKCDYDPCHCKTNPETAVVLEKSVFCSQGCADGHGCDHPHCDCSSA